MTINQILDDALEINKNKELGIYTDNEVFMLYGFSEENKTEVYDFAERFPYAIINENNGEMSITLYKEDIL